MGSPITLSGFNNIDFTQILNAIMAQERQPVDALQSQKRALEAQKSAFGALASKLAALESSVEGVTGIDAFRGAAVTVSDPARVSASAASTTPEGTFQIYVDHLAKAQVLSGTDTFANTDVVLAARAGTIKFTSSSGGTVNITLATDVTLEGLADAINAAANSPATASIVRTVAGQYQLMLTGKETGAGSTFTFDATTNAGGNFSFATAQAAQDAQIRFNGVTATSTTNTFEGVIHGLSFFALKEDVANPVLLTITASHDSVVNLVQKVVAAFNETTKFISEQTTAARNGETQNIGRDSLLRGLTPQLTRIISRSYPGGGRYSSLSEVGFELTRSGELKFNETKFRDAIKSGRADVEALFRGADGHGGAFGDLAAVIGAYTKAGGLVPNAQDRLTDQLTRLSDRVALMEARLAQRRLALQQEFIAADRTLSQLNAQQNSLSRLGSEYRLF